MTRYIQTVELEARYGGGKRYVVVDSDTDAIVRGTFRTYAEALKAISKPHGTPYSSEFLRDMEA